MQDNQEIIEINFFSTVKTIDKNNSVLKVEALIDTTPRLLVINKTDTLEELKLNLMKYLSPLFPS